MICLFWRCLRQWRSPSDGFKISFALRESGHYQVCRELFVSRKLKEWHFFYFYTLPEQRPHFLQLIRESMTPDDWIFCRKEKKRDFSGDPALLLNHGIRNFYLLRIGGGQLGTLEYCLRQLAYHLLEFIKWPERLLRRRIIKPLKKMIKSRITKNKP